MRTTILLAFLLAACGGDDGAPVEPDADPTAPDAAPTDVIEAGTVLVPGELVEAMMHGGPDQRAVIHLTAPNSELDWNIHGHANGETQTIYEELNIMTADYEFVPEAEADWWLLLRNSGPVEIEVQVRAELYGDMTWEWQ